MHSQKSMKQRAPRAARRVATPRRRVATAARRTAPRRATVASASVARKVSTSTLSSSVSTSIPAVAFRRPTSFGMAPFAAQAFSASRRLRDEQDEQVHLDPAKVFFQAQKFLQTDISALNAETDSAALDELLKTEGLSSEINDQGVITAVCKRFGFECEYVLDAEFEYAEEEEEEANSNSTEEGHKAFHNITVTVKRPAGESLRIGGQLFIDGEFQVQSFTPYSLQGAELRTVVVDDFSDGTLNAVFDALEVSALNVQTLEAILEIARFHRIQTHAQALSSMVNFFNSAEVPPQTM